LPANNKTNQNSFSLNTGWNFSFPDESRGVAEGIEDSVGDSEIFKKNIKHPMGKSN